jgi:hypothetical protein
MILRDYSERGLKAYSRMMKNISDGTPKAMVLSISSLGVGDVMPILSSVTFKLEYIIGKSV